MIKLPAVGKIGKLDAKTWDHNGKTGIRQIFVSYDLAGVNALQFQYVENRRYSFLGWPPAFTVLSEIIGTIGMNNDFQTVQLDYPREYLTSVIIYKSSEKLCGIGGIAFTTDMGELLGPYPPVAADHDITPVCYHFGDDNQFGGFHGTACPSALTSIGVYVRPNLYENMLMRMISDQLNKGSYPRFRLHFTCQVCSINL